MGAAGGGGAEVLGGFGQELAGDLELAAVSVLASLGLRSGGLEDDDLLGTSWSASAVAASSAETRFTVSGTLVSCVATCSPIVT